MEYSTKTRVCSNIVDDLEKGKISKNYHLQRKPGIWNAKTKSLFIDTLLRGYLVNPIYMIVEDGKRYIIDGIQRIGTVESFMKNEFSLSKELEPVEINGELKEIAGKRFKKLDEDTQKIIENAELKIYEITKYTDKEILETFARVNAGKSLNTRQKRILVQDSKVRAIVSDLASHPAMSKLLTNANIKGDDDKETIFQVLMILSDQLTSFRDKDMTAFVQWYNEHIDNSEIEIIKKALDNIDAAFEEKIKIKKLCVPMVIYGMCKAIMNKKSTAKYIDWVKKFIEGYDNNTEFLAFCDMGTSGADKVKGRIDYFKNAVNKL